MADPEERESEESLSMVDVLAEEAALEENAKAVLGDSDDKNCTYAQGYVKRQALYACNTCMAHGGEPVGICLACSLECHEGHELLELYTKRNFRCDCGNSKFTGLTCRLTPDKVPTNDRNKYDHNFRGSYCLCERPYPDPDDEVEDEMLQCIVCEDWYHGRHLQEATLPDADSYDEVICGSCSAKLDFLQSYLAPNYLSSAQSKEPGKEATIMKEEADTEGAVLEQSRTVFAEGGATEPALAVKRDCCGDTKPNERSATNGVSGTSECCQLVMLTPSKLGRSEGSRVEPTFLPLDWRSRLCRCGKCQASYATMDVEFLLDENDTLSAYEARGRLKHSSSYEQGMRALSSLDRTQQVEMLQGYNEMKNSLSEYLQGFAQTGKVVREEDIREFFQDFQSKKRLRTNMPQFCK